MSQKIVERAREIAKRMAGECKDCGGSGRWNSFAHGPKHGDYGDSMRITPCPSCARLREIAEWCWHEILEDSQENPYKEAVCSCGIQGLWFECEIVLHLDNNPTFTIPQLRELLQDLGLWPGFAGWNHDNSSPLYDLAYGDASELLSEAYDLMPEVVAEILTTESLMTEAVEKFMEVRDGHENVA